MSGRLIILPKKTWHVWRRDNIERVKRDERLAAEADEALEQKQRDIEQELRLETLKKRQHLSSSSSSSSTGAPQAKPTGKNKRKQEVPEAKGGVNEGWGHGNEHVNLFPATEQKGRGNAEYLAEQQTLELHKQRREGNAPVALGRDPTVSSPHWQSAAYKQLQYSALGQSTLNPWYIKDRQTTIKEIKAAPTTVVIRGQLLQGKHAEKALDRDDARKLALDPMAKLVKHSQSDWDIAASNTVHAANSSSSATASHTTAAPAATAIVRHSIAMDGSSAVQQKEAVKRSKDSSKRKHSKDKKHKHSSKKRRRDSSSSSSDSDSSSVHKRSKSNASSSSSRKAAAAAAAAAAASVTMEELRQRRLERERQARMATAHLSAQTACSNSVTPVPLVHEAKYVHYHEQFNPTLARQNALMPR
eukprot:21477-Heterococcus_DN1.PRE.6